MSYHIEFTEKAKKDIDSFRKAGEKVILSKILILLNELSEHPYQGRGKPEVLKFELSGLWSRRINKEHRLVYEVQGDIVNILSAKGHY